jgi:hypothetical protein
LYSDAPPSTVSHKNVTIAVMLYGRFLLVMDDKNYSWKGSPNAGKVLVILAAIAGLTLVLAGFSY